MKTNNTILMVFIVSLLLFLQLGCEEERKLPDKSNLPTQQITPAVAPAKAEVVEPIVDLKKPKIEFEKVIHDFGSIGPGTKQSCNFNFKNIGDGLLRIGKVKATCGCTVPKLKKKEYQPGESGTIKVRYSAEEHPGKVNRKLYVSNSDKKNPNVMLTIKAKVELKIDYQPKKLKLLLQEANAGASEITIKSLDGQPFAIKRVKSTAGCITIVFDPDEQAEKFVFEPIVNVERLKKTLKGSINFYLSHPQTGRITIFYEALPHFKVEPAALSILNAVPQNSTKREVWVLNNYDKGFEIESVSSAKGFVKLLSEEKVLNEQGVATRYKLELEITPPPVVDKARAFSDIIQINIKDKEKLEISCRGFYARNNASR